MSDQERPGPENPVPTSRLWGGGFRQPLDPTLDRFCASFAFDRRLLDAEVRVNRAWVEALAAAGLLKPSEAAVIDAGLAAIAAAPIPAGAAAEDIHTYVEARLAENAGADLAGRLRTGRSRNDLVATDVRLWCAGALAAARADLAGCVGDLAALAERCGELAVPGYTHLRRAQPILLAHLILAHAQRLMRDDGRLAEAASHALDACPLGCGALAGTTAPIDRHALSQRLGFARPAANSLDAVSDRDFVADALHSSALTMIHLSQIAEDLILATAEEFGWLALSDAAATGSSLMPQKKNPDVLELLRGKSGRLLGRQAGFLATLKGLPAAYNRDLQEDKEPLFDALDTVTGSLRALRVVLAHLAPVRHRALPDDGGDLLATDLADDLAARGLPFAQAHTLAGEAAERARERGVPLGQGQLTVTASLARRDRVGGTAPARVADQLREVRAWAVRRLGGAPLAADEFRLRAAWDDDLELLQERITYWSRRGVLLPLGGRELRTALPDFRVLTPGNRPGTVLAFGALRRYSSRLAELRSLVVGDGQQGRGLGRRLVAHLLDEARREGLRKVFVLTRAPGFFERLGFVKIDRESLPQKVFVDCNQCGQRDACDEQALMLELP